MLIALFLYQIQCHFIINFNAIQDHLRSKWSHSALALAWYWIGIGNDIVIGIAKVIGEALEHNSPTYKNQRLKPINGTPGQ
jgi:hypothetical protein